MSATYPFPDTLPPPRNRGKGTQVHTPQETHYLLPETQGRRDPQVHIPPETHHLLWKHRGEGTPKSPGCTLEEHPRVWAPQCRFQRDEKQKPCRVCCPSPYPALVWSPGSLLCPSPPTPAWVSLQSCPQSVAGREPAGGPSAQSPHCSGRCIDSGPPAAQTLGARR